MAGKSGWTVGFFSDSVYRDMQDLPDPIQRNFVSILEKIKDMGPYKVPSQYIKRLKGKDDLWEMRLRGRGTIARALYVKWVGRRIIIVCVFEKKSQGIPKHILQLARKRAREVKNVW